MAIGGTTVAALTEEVGDLFETPEIGYPHHPFIFFDRGYDGSMDRA